MQPRLIAEWRIRAQIAATLLACVALLGAAPAAFAHAQLLSTEPASGATLAAQPKLVVFEFGENVGGTLGAVRVYGAAGNEVDDASVSHPQGDAHALAVGLRAGLPDGTYTATYRVVSADTHIVYGGLVFNIGHASAASNITVAGLIKRNESGRVTKIAFGVTRALDYVSIALMLGALAFVLIAWGPAARALAVNDADAEQWRTASLIFTRRLQRLLYVAIALGATVSVLGFLLQGASAAGVSLWTSLKGSVLNDTLDTRFGTVWAVRALDWLALGALLIGAQARGRALVTALRSRAILAAFALGAAYLALTPALAGHASIEHPTWLFFPSDVLHVLAASVWVGGIACLLLALPAATGRLAGPQRTRLLLATLARFSPLALAAVVTIAITGIVQALIDVRNFDGLVHTTYGALVIVKVALLLVLITLGWVNRDRVLPALRRLVEAGSTPGAAGVLARRTMRSELALMLCVFGVTAALISYTPPIDADAGPFSIDTTLGAAELEMTLEPAEVGLNTAHIYLIDARSGTQFTQTKELTVTAKLPAKNIGPIALKTIPAGPGHYILNSAVLSPAGTWQLEVTDRVSEFEQHSRTIDVPIR
ncbi:MAG TPA: CopD family protein [Solirubrobacteraceae bacterium]|jgi:copper transport protein|nr:CopD family protein [Solirubrobacteraceae bacterium]